MHTQHASIGDESIKIPNKIMMIIIFMMTLHNELFNFTVSNHQEMKVALDHDFNENYLLLDTIPLKILIFLY